MVYESRFVRGLGRRPLTTRELGTIWGLADTLFSCLWNHADLPPVPIHLPDALLRGYLARLPADPIVLNESKRRRLPDSVDMSGGVWLPDIGRILLPTWERGAVLSLTSAKDDGVAVATTLWNDRIQSLWPVTDSALDALRAAIYNFRRRELTWEFTAYLARWHGEVYYRYLRVRGLCIAIGPNGGYKACLLVGQERRRLRGEEGHMAQSPSFTLRNSNVIWLLGEVY